MPAVRRTVIQRYKAIIFLKMEKLYLESKHRDRFLSVMKIPLNNFLLEVVNDPYMSEVNEIFLVGSTLNRKIKDLLTEAEKCRSKWLDQFYYGVNVNEFVLKNNRVDIYKFMVKVTVASFFLQVINNLETARSRGGLREREELSIIRKAKEENNTEQVRTIKEVGFEWREENASKQIEALYNKLLKRGYIDRQTSSEQFNQLFNSQPVEFPVMWLKTSFLFMYLIEELLNQKLIEMPDGLEPKRERCKELLIKINRRTITEEENAEYKSYLHEVSRWQYERMAACFVNKTVKPYNSDTLKSTRNKLINQQDGIPAGGGELKIMIADIAAIKK